MAFEEIIFLPEALKCQGSLAVFRSLLAAQIEKAKLWDQDSLLLSCHKLSESPVCGIIMEESW